MKIVKLGGALGAVIIAAALACGPSALADEGGRGYRAAPHHEFTDSQQTPYRPAPHHPQPGEVTIPYELVADPPAAESSGGGIDRDDAVIGGAVVALLAATAGAVALARRQRMPRTASGAPDAS